MTDICVFCGYEGDEFDPEHWVPKWLSRALIPKHGEMIGHVAEDRSIRMKRYFDYTVPHVCKTCNSGWMSDIESRASYDGDVLRMVLGVPEPPPSREAQTKLASWCFLKAITLELGRPEAHEPTYPRTVYEAFKRDKTPPRKACSIALGLRTIPARASNPVFLWHKSQGRIFPVGPGGVYRETGYLTTLLIGHLVIDVAGLLRPLNAQLDHGEGFVPLWPSLPGKEFPWPPSKRFSGVVNNDLV